ncbi:MAG: hypothetical protein RL318_1963 [Fibrobacterota bacterium]|jgi:PAS domain S-box-containing protein
MTEPAMIMLVDDDPAILSFYRKILDSTDGDELDLLGETRDGPGLELRHKAFPDAQDMLTWYAQSLAGGRKCPLAVLDIRMPGLSGIEAAKRLRAMDPEIELVLCSAFSDHTIGEIRKTLGNTFHFVRKPFAHEEFHLLLQSLCTSWKHKRDVAKGKRHLADIIEAMQAGTWEWNVQTGEVSFNERWAGIIGYRLEELMPVSIRTWSQLCHPDDLAESDRLLKSHFLKESSHYDFECRMAHKDGHWVWVHDRGKVVEWDHHGQPLRMSGTHLDITPRKFAQEQLELSRRHDAETALRATRANNAKSEFLANMSHEIRTPLTGVLGMADLLLNTSLDSEQKSFADVIRSSGTTLLDLINNILDLSKIEAGKLEIDVHEFDLRSLVEETIDSIAVKAQQKNLELTGIVSPVVPSRLKGDAGRLRQILTNLLGNAVKFTEHGTIDLEINSLQDSDHACMLEILVRDTGIGIPQEKLVRIFEPFEQADQSTTRRFGGTGLGLTISRTLVHLMGGTIQAESYEGVGTIFRVNLEIQKLPPLAKAQSVPPHSVLHGKKVLIIDPNLGNCRQACILLTGLGLLCSSLRDSDEAMDILREAAAVKQPFDIVIVERIMQGGIDGIALGAQIHSALDLGAPQMVLMTSLGLRGDAKLAKDAGFSSYLTKPLRRSRLRECLEEILSRPRDGKESILVTRHTLEAMHRTGRILLAEDNPTNRTLVIRLLQNLGHHVDSVTNGEDAVKALCREPYDLVLMDCQMPVMDGLAATRLIRSSSSGALRHDIPIIALSADVFAEEKEQCRQAGMNGHLSKPLDLKELRQTLHHWLDPDSDFELSQQG